MSNQVNSNIVSTNKDFFTAEISFSCQLGENGNFKIQTFYNGMDTCATIKIMISQQDTQIETHLTEDQFNTIWNLMDKFKSTMPAKYIDKSNRRSYPPELEDLEEELEEDSEDVHFF